MLSKKAINQFREISKDWGVVDYSKYTDKELSPLALIWLGLPKNKKRYTKTKRTKLFYLAVARLQIAKPKFLFMMVAKTRFGIGYVRTANLFDELEAAGVLKKHWLKPGGTNINWEVVNKIRVPKEIMKEARQMKPMKGYSYTKVK